VTWLKRNAVNQECSAKTARPQTPIERLKPGEVVIFDEDEIQYLAQMQENAINNVLHWREARLKELIRMCNVSVSKYLRQIGA
jgi:fructose-1,6-bisphosphatase